MEPKRATRIFNLYFLLPRLHIARNGWQAASIIVDEF
jgi:hypothetical protein